MSRIFGEVRQNGYVVRDVEAAMRHWTQTLGVGPFFYFERVPLEDFRFRGEPSPIEVWTTSFDADLKHAVERGYSIGQSGQVGGPDGRFVYFDTQAHPGTIG